MMPELTRREFEITVDIDTGVVTGKFPRRALRLVLALGRHMFLHVVEARYVRDYIVWLRFRDGTAGEVDLCDELDGPVFGPLRDIERFQRFSVAHHTLTWDTGADFAPELLRERVVVTV